MKGYCFCCRVCSPPYGSVVEIQGSWRGKAEVMIDRHKQGRDPYTLSVPLLVPSGENASAKSAPKCLFLNKVGCISLVCAVRGGRAGVCSRDPKSVSLKMQMLCISLSFFSWLVLDWDIILLDKVYNKIAQSIYVERFYNKNPGEKLPC